MLRVLCPRGIASRIRQIVEATAWLRKEGKRYSIAEHTTDPYPSSARLVVGNTTRRGDKASRPIQKSHPYLFSIDHLVPLSVHGLVSP